jgi:hypothetical protein
VKVEKVKAISELQPPMLKICPDVVDRYFQVNSKVWFKVNFAIQLHDF